MKNKFVILIIILLCITIQNCYRISNLENHWKDKYNIKANTGIFVGKFDLSRHWKDKKVIAFLTDTKYRNNIIAYDTINTSGYVILRNIPNGTYFLNTNDRIYGKDTVSYNYIDYLKFSFDDCYFYYLDILTDTITYVEIKAPGRRIMPYMPVIPEEKQAEIKDSCKIEFDLYKLNEYNYRYFDSLKGKEN